MVDGTVVVDTDLDEEGFEHGSDKLLDAINRLQQSVDNIGTKMQQAFASVITVLQNLGTVAQQTSTDVAAQTNSADRASSAADRAAESTSRAAGATRNYEKEMAKLQRKLEEAEADLADYYEQLNQITELADEAVANAWNDSEREEAEATRSDAIDRLNRKYAEQLAAIQKIEDAMTRLREEQEAAAASATRASDTEEQADRRKSNRLSELIQKLRQYRAEMQKSNIQANALVQKLTSLKTLLITRLKRMFISAVMEHIQEGLKSLRKYNAAYDAAMKGLRRSTAEMGGALAVAFANLVTTIAPFLIKLLDMLTKVITAINMFFAALQGKTTVTVAHATQEYVDATEDAAAAQKKLNAELYSFDELNKQKGDDEESQTGPSMTFEEVPISDKILKFANFIKEHLREIKDLAIAIGAAFATWKIGSAILKALGKDTLSAKLKLAGLAAAIAGATLYTFGFLDAWKKGPDWGNLVEMIGGAGLAAVGLGIAFKSLKAASIGLAVGGIGMLVVGIKDWIQKGELGTKTFWTMEAGLAAAGIGLAAFTGGWSLLVAAVAAAGLAIYKYWDKIKGWFSNAGTAIKNWFSRVGADLKLAFIAVKAYIQNGLTQIGETLTTKFEEFKTSVALFGQSIADHAVAIFTAIGEWWTGTVVPGITAAIQWVVNGFQQFFAAISLIWNSLVLLAIQVFESIKNFIITTGTEILTFLQNTWNLLLLTAQQIFTSIKQHIVDMFTAARDFIHNTWENIKHTTVTTLTAIRTMIVSYLNSIYNKGIDIITTIHNVFNTKLDSMYKSATAKLSALHTAFISGLTAIGNFCVSSFTSLTSWFASQSWYNIGVNLMQGFLDGIRSLMQRIWDEVVAFCQRVADAVRNALGVHSPSRVFEEIGEYTGLGFINGLKKEQSAAIQTAQNLADAVTEEMANGIGTVDVSASGMQMVISKLSTVADIFRTIAQTLSSIGILQAPQISTGSVIPTQTRIAATANNDGDSETVLSFLESILSELQALGATVRSEGNQGTVIYKIIANGREIFNLVVDENDRAIQRTGKSPIRV